MSNDLSGPLSWARDIAIAYAGGLVIGAPVALVAVWLTGTERVSTICLLLAMLGVLVVLRRTPRWADAASPGATRQREITRRVA